MGNNNTILGQSGHFEPIVPTVTYIENNSLMKGDAYRIFLSGILYNDAEQIEEEFDDNTKYDESLFRIFQNNGSKKGLIILVSADRFDEFIGTKGYRFKKSSPFGQLYMYISNNFRSDYEGKNPGEKLNLCYYRGAIKSYSNSDNPDQKKLVKLKDLFEIVIRLKMGTGTPTDVKNTNDKVSRNWADIANALNDPKTRDRLLKYQMSNSFKKKYGWNLSPNNRFIILSQNPEASFVLTPSQWYDRYQRVIKPDAEKLTLIQPYKNNHASDNEIRIASKERGFNGSLNTGSLQVDNGNRLSAEAEKVATGFVTKIVYDVQDTELIPGITYDRWSVEMGLSNQFTGELNNSALKDAEATERIRKDEEEKNSNSKENLEMNEYVVKATSNLKEYCLRNKIRYIKSPDQNTNLSNLVYAVALSDTERNNIIRPSNKQNFADTIRYMVMGTIGVPYSKASLYNPKEKWTMEHGSQFYSTIKMIMNIMEREPKEVKAFKESYNNILSRLGNVIL